MIINSVECNDFAGLHDKNISFNDGLNIILGDNEAGKSTVIELMYHVLYQNSKMLKKDEAFRFNFFTSFINGKVASKIDGTLNFNTETGNFVLKKQWNGGKGKASIEHNGFTISTDDGVNDVLTNELVYGKGLFDEIVFPSQKRRGTVIQDLFPQKKKDKNEHKTDIISAVNKAVINLGGISINLIEEKLLHILKKYGERWDKNRKEPEGGSFSRGLWNKWAVARSAAADRGEKAIVLRAYYDYEYAKSEYEYYKSSCESYKNAQNELKLIKKQMAAQKEKIESYRNIKSTIDQSNQYYEIIKEAEILIAQYEKDLYEWPLVISAIEELQLIRSTVIYNEAKNKFALINSIDTEISRLLTEISSIKYVSDELLDEIEEKCRSLSILTSKASGVSLKATVNSISPHNIIAKKSIDGTIIKPDGNTYDINSPVQIVIDGDTTVTLFPADIDMDNIMSQIKDIREYLENHTEVTSIGDIREIRRQNKKYANIQSQIDNFKNKKELYLGQTTWDEIVELYNNPPKEIVEATELERIKKKYGNKPIDVLINEHEVKLKSFINIYNSISSLRNKLKEKQQLVQSYKDRLNILKNIPDEFKFVENTQDYEERLVGEYDRLKSDLNDIVSSMSWEREKVESGKDGHFETNLKEAKDRYDTVLSEYDSWCHIYEVYLQTRDEVQGIPMQDVATNFKKYLSEISSGRLNLVSVNDDMEIALDSNNHAMRYELLSEGTKNTVLLAFRLALLEHLYPNGGGLAIFDDPFTDMDEKRVIMACNMVKEFAKKNQVIFITCDSKYKKMLGGNIINF